MTDSASPSFPRGQRNNNPLNIRIVGRNNWRGRVPVAQNTDGQFEQFDTMVNGLRAAFVLLDKYYRVDGLCSVWEIISKWAPQSDGNDPHKYAAYVAERAGIPVHWQWGRMSPTLRKDIVAAMSQYESRYKPSPDELEAAYQASLS